jgi:hypothetical protein
MAPDEDILEVEARVERKIDAIAYEMADCHEELTAKIERMDESLRGNGQPGVLTRMAVMDEKIAALTAFADEVQGFKRWVMAGVITLIASMLMQSLGLFP